MCRKDMDIKAKHMRSDCLRRIVSPGSRVGWKLLRVSVEEDEALKHWRSGIVKATIRKYIQQEKKRARLIKLAKTSKNTEGMEETHSTGEKANTTALLQLPPPGAMAPENTTQYLMGNVYEDLCKRRPITHNITTVLHQTEGL